MFGAQACQAPNSWCCPVAGSDPDSLSPASPPATTGVYPGQPPTQPARAPAHTSTSQPATKTSRPTTASQPPGHDLHIPASQPASQPATQPMDACPQGAKLKDASPPAPRPRPRHAGSCTSQPARQPASPPHRVVADAVPPLPPPVLPGLPAGGGLPGEEVGAQVADPGGIHPHRRLACAGWGWGGGWGGTEGIWRSRGWGGLEITCEGACGLAGRQLVGGPAGLPLHHHLRASDAELALPGQHQQR